VLSEGQVYLHKSLIIEFVYLVPISVMNVFIAPYFRLISSFLSYFSNNNVFLFLLAIKLFLYVLHVFNIAYCRQWKLSLCFILYIVVLHDYQNKILFIFFKKWAAETDFRGMADCERLSGHSAKRSSRIYMPVEWHLICWNPMFRSKVIQKTWFSSSSQNENVCPFVCGFVCIPSWF